MEELIYMRAEERRELYDKADKQIAKCNDFITMTMNVDLYVRYRTSLIEYKMDVRDTVNQDDYPDEVEYPKFPRVEE